MGRNLSYLKGAVVIFAKQSLKLFESNVLIQFCIKPCRFKVTTDKYIQRLMIQTVRMSDAGEYSVVAGSSMSKAQLVVEGKDVRITEPVEKEITVNIFGPNDIILIFCDIMMLPKKPNIAHF